MCQRHSFKMRDRFSDHVLGFIVAFLSSSSFIIPKRIVGNERFFFLLKIKRGGFRMIDDLNQTYQFKPSRNHLIGSGARIKLDVILGGGREWLF